MKIHLDIDCTPGEARQFFGLPDISKMQEDLLADIHKQLKDNINSTDPETLMKTWLPMTMQGMGEMQKMFWDNLRQTTQGGPAGSKNTKDDDG